MSTVRALAKLAFATVDLVLTSPAGPRILIYHQVGAKRGRQMEVDVDHFARQLEWLAHNRKVVDIETALKEWKSENADQLVVFTFDDGYREVYTTAFPMLKERGFPFTLYLTTAAIESGAPDSQPLTWSQIEEMLGSGLVTVGSHTHTHLDLRNPDVSRIREELHISDSLITARLGLKPRHFAYPWGYWSNCAEGVVRERYASAVLGAPYRSHGSRFDPHRLHRYPIQLSDGMRWFPAKLRGGLLLEERVRRILRGYRGP